MFFLLFVTTNKTITFHTVDITPPEPKKNQNKMGRALAKAGYVFATFPTH